MEKFIASDTPEDARWEIILNTAECTEEIGYTHRFTPEELAQKKEMLAETSIKINDIEVEKKEAMEEYKSRLKPLTEKKQTLLDNIKKGSEYRDNEVCAKIVEDEERMVGYYNKLGELVYSRPIMPREMQKSIFMNRKTGTED